MFSRLAHRQANALLRCSLTTRSPTLIPSIYTSPIRIRKYSEDSFPIAKYNELADHTLEQILEGYEILAEDVPEVDCDLAQGVFTLTLPPIGTYVINKQPPNKQIWLSSPISGPKRYDWVDGKWTYLRDNSTLGSLLREETKTITDAKGCSELNLVEVD